MVFGYRGFAVVPAKNRSLLFKSASVALAATLALGLVPAAAFAESVEADPDDHANSWRYDDGAWLYAEDGVGANAASGSAADGSAADDGVAASDGIMALSYKEGWNWPKVPGGYQSNDNSVVPAIRKGIDVSYHQGLINWEKVKADGIDFVILRCGYVRTLGQPQVDKQWKRNAQECERLGIPYGVYIYSYAKTVQAAKAEADHVVNTLRGFHPTYPVYFDLEETSLESTLNRDLLADMATTFCDRVSSAGYTPGIYANTNWWNNFLTDPVFSQWDRWVAQYNSKCTYKGSYRLWQCSSSGKVDGIVGNVDLDLERDGAFATVDMNKTWVQEGSRWFLRNGAGVKLTGWQVVNGKRYYLGGDGVMQTGWIQHGGARYYLSGSGAAKTGWLKSGGSWYYLNTHGKALTGWQTIDGKRYYLDPSTAVMATGVCTIDGKRYRFDESGALAEELDSPTPPNGGGSTPSNPGNSSTGSSLTWAKIDGQWYLKGPSSENLTGWQTVDGKRYYLNAKGVMVTGWQQLDGKWYYFKGGGSLSTGWQKVAKTWYLLADDGVMLTGWQKIGPTWYYLRASGAMAANCWVGNYYLTSSGAMATNTWVGKYHVNASGKWDATR